MDIYYYFLSHSGRRACISSRCVNVELWEDDDPRHRFELLGGSSVKSVWLMSPILGKTKI